MTTTPRSTRRKLLLAAAVFLVTLVAGAAVAESVVRSRLVTARGATDFESLRTRFLGQDLKIFERDEKGNLQLVPGTKQGSGITINAQGFRGEPVPLPKPEGTLRIVCIGGSGLFGTVSSGDATTIPAYLEEILRARVGGAYRVEVVNGGLPGATTSIAIARYQKHLSGLRADLVLLYNLVNDLAASRRARLGLDLRRQPLVALDGPVSELLSHSALWLQWRAAEAERAKAQRVVEATLREAQAGAGAAAGAGAGEVRDGHNAAALATRAKVAAEGSHVYDGRPESNLYLVPEHLAEFRGLLERFREVVRASGATPVYCTFAFRFRGDETQEEYTRQGPATAYWMPSWPMARDAFAAMNAAIREAAASSRTPLCDVDRELVRAPGLYPPEDTDHLTDEGCRAVAELIAEALIRQGLVRAGEGQR